MPLTGVINYVFAFIWFMDEFFIVLNSKECAVRNTQCKTPETIHDIAKLRGEISQFFSI